MDGALPLKTSKDAFFGQANRCLPSLVNDGVSRPGEQLHSQRGLAARLDISRSTLRGALRKFEQESMIVRRRGLGTSSADPCLAKRLRAERRQAVLLVKEQLFDERDPAIEFSPSYFAPDLFQFHLSSAADASVSMFSAYRECGGVRGRSGFVKGRTIIV